MLADIVKKLMEHVQSQHTVHGGKDVNYFLDGGFTIEETDGHVFLEFNGEVLAHIPPCSAPLGLAHSIQNGDKIVDSTRVLANELIIKDSAQRGLPPNYYQTYFSGLSNIKIKVVGEYGQIKQEEVYLERSGICKPPKVEYQLHRPIFTILDDLTPILAKNNS